MFTMFMLRDEKSTVNSVEDLKDINRRIVSLGEQYGKPVCATWRQRRPVLSLCP